jgi:hypothetical protein
MTTPVLYDIHETAERTHLSVSWLYRHAGKTIPVTRPGGAKKLFWTGEQIEQIIRDGAQPAKGSDAKRAPKQRKGAEVKPEPTPGPKPRTSGAPIPQARPERSRRYRSAAVAEPAAGGA